jgi:roadblock/LC7 domain-containing protein
MSVISELMDMSGTVAAGEFSFRGDRYSYQGNMSEEMARMASIMCRSTSMSTHMETDMLGTFCGEGCGLIPAKGWAVRGPSYSVCVVHNYFCFMDNQQADFNKVLHYMQQELANTPDDLI